MSLPFAHGLKIVVFTCGDFGYEVASLLRQTDQIGQITVIQTPYSQPRRSFRRKIAHIYRMEGTVGIVRGIVLRLEKLLGLNRHVSVREAEHWNLQGLKVLSFQNFHDAECLQAIRKLQPDLGVVAGTYILKPEVFPPRASGVLTCIVARSLNIEALLRPSGNCTTASPRLESPYTGLLKNWTLVMYLRRRRLASPRPPPGDPLQYLDDFRATVLRPNGVRMLRETIARIAAGDMRSQPQPANGHRTFFSPDYAAKKELLL